MIKDHCLVSCFQQCFDLVFSLFSLLLCCHFNSMERLDHLALKFKHKCDIHEAWTSGKAGMLKKDDLDSATFAEVLVSVLLCFFLVLLF